MTVILTKTQIFSAALIVQNQLKIGIIITTLLIVRLPGIAQMPDMIPIPGGIFQMGHSAGDADEKPVHKVELSSFYLARTETTFTQFKTFVDACGYVTDAERGDGSFVWDSLGWHKKDQINWRHDERGRLRSRTGGNYGDYPVLHLSWQDAAHYCNWLSMQSGLQQVYTIQEDTVWSTFSATGYRLPSEAEWEYAAAEAKASQAQPYSGSGSLHALAWCSGNSNHRVHATAQRKANKFGLYDLTGNVWEWCHDWYARDFYTQSQAKANPTGPLKGQEHGLRGGSWNNNRAHGRLTNRSSRYPDFRDGSVGFRVARILPG